MQYLWAYVKAKLFNITHIRDSRAHMYVCTHGVYCVACIECSKYGCFPICLCIMCLDVLLECFNVV
jgi:hypothetical protein